MNLREYDNNQYTKEKNEVEKYLIRIIQRYFDIENNYTKESVEAIILESLSRLKQLMVFEKGFVFSLNQQTGNINLTIRDFNGERIIKKNSAFNKDFGTTNDTICEGNDSRLSDEREPIPHTHTFMDINSSLGNISEKVKTIQNVHVHNNSLLDALSYTGSSVELDLALLEKLEHVIDSYYNMFDNYKANISNHENSIANAVTTNKTIMLTELTNAKDFIKNAKTRIDDIRKYVDQKIHDIELSIATNKLNYITKEKLQSIMDFIKKSYFVTNTGEVLIPEGNITCSPYHVDIENDVSFIQEKSCFNINVGNVNNFKPKMYFRYEDNNGKTQTFPLPYCSIKGENDKEFLLINGDYDNNNIYITSTFINKINYYADSSNFYDDKTIITQVYKNPKTYRNAFNDAANSNCKIALVDSEDKNNFIKNMLHDVIEYYIQGHNFSLDGSDYIDDAGNILSYTDWDDGEPNPPGMSSNIKYNTNKKWADADGASERLGYVVEYKIKSLSEVYNNARIYYQVLENKEGL